MVAVMETELWLNFFWAAKTFEARTLLVNGRISDRSFKRSKSLKFFYRYVLGMVDKCLMQSQGDAERIKTLGAVDAEVFGNCKFDQAVEDVDVDTAQVRSDLGLIADLPVIVIGSTRGEEEERLVLDALEGIGGTLAQIIHAPRHLERVSDLADAVKSRFGKVALRSKRAWPLSPSRHLRRAVQGLCGGRCGGDRWRLCQARRPEPVAAACARKACAARAAYA